jgi:hypothetical protein
MFQNITFSHSVQTRVFPIVHLRLETFSPASLRSLLFSALAMTSYASTSRYDITLPEKAAISNSDRGLRNLTSNHNVTIDEFNGGYIIKELDGTVLAYNSDEVSKKLDGRIRSLQLFEMLLEEKGVSENDLYDVFSAALSCSRPVCVYQGASGKCGMYAGCYYCAHTHRCI